MALSEKKQRLSGGDESRRIPQRASPEEESLAFQERERLKAEGWGEQIKKAFFPKKETKQTTPDRKPEKPAEPSPKRDFIFQGKNRIARIQLRERLRKADPAIPRTGGKMLSKQARVKIEKRLFPPGKFWKHGKFSHTHVSRREYEGVIKQLGKARWKAKTKAEKLKINRDIRVLRKWGGL